MDPTFAITALTWMTSNAAQGAPLAWVLASILGGILGNEAHRIYREKPLEIAKAFTPLTVPENHDLARAVRTAQIEALERLCLDYRDAFRSRWNAAPNIRPASFLDHIDAVCRDARQRLVDAAFDQSLTDNLRAAFEGLLSDAEAGGAAADRTRLMAALAEDAVFEELRATLGAIQFPLDFEVHFRNGTDTRPRFMHLFGAFFAEQIKQDGPARNIFTAKLLTRVEGLAYDSIEIARRIELQFGTLLAELKRDTQTIRQDLEEARARDAERHAELKQLVIDAAGGGASAVEAILRIRNVLRRNNPEIDDVPAERIPELVNNVIEDLERHGAITERFQETVQRALKSERDRALRAESKTLAMLSRQASNAGDPAKGMLLALEALPINANAPNRPIVVDAEMALLEAYLRNAGRYQEFRYVSGEYYATFSPDGQNVATPWHQGVAIWALEDKFSAKVNLEPVAILEHESVAQHFAFSPDSRKLAIGSRDGTIRIWVLNRAPPTCVVMLRHTCWIRSVSFSPDGQRVAAGSDDGKVWVFDANSFLQIGATLIGHSGPIRTVSFSPNSRHVVTASDDGTARVWDLTDVLSADLVLSGHTGSVRAASFSPDGFRILTASDDSTARVWTLNGQSPALTVLEGHTKEVLQASFSRNGERIVTASNDSTARVWNWDDSLPVATVLPHSCPVWDAAFSPDGSRIVTACIDVTPGQERMVRLWHVTGQVTSEAVLIPGDYEFLMLHVEFSPDGQSILTSGQRRTLIWRTPSLSALMPLARNALTRTLTDDEREAYEIPASEDPK